MFLRNPLFYKEKTRKVADSNLPPYTPYKK
ncbi:hypothetical protein [Vibrio phage vB_VpaS_CHI]|nr:hypothetical protein [Vibrio phage vB_VpaS_ALK]USL90154.1 hypothetical protein [Vibrio phage vB_VpaS_CHI]